jgi:hypothetical protein
MSTFPCRDCGTPVAWRTAKSGKRYLDQPWEWQGGDYSLHTKTIHGSHWCTPNPTWKEEAAAIVAAEFAADLAAGNIVKNAPVIVFKGRKVPVGTTGVISWIGEDSYGAARVGIRTESGEVVYTAQSNVQLLQEATK